MSLNICSPASAAAALVHLTRWHNLSPPAACGSPLLQIVAFDQTLKASGDVAFFMWRSVYITKQVGALKQLQALTSLSQALP
jgi:hypothetical protein